MKIKNMNNAGTTLVELMVYMIVGLIVITGALKVISNATGSYVHGRAVSKAQFSARDGVSAMSRDISSMGFKTYFKENNSGQATMTTDKFGETSIDSAVGIKNGVNRHNLDGNTAAFFYYTGSVGTNGNEVGDTLEFYRIRINDVGQRIDREKVEYYLDIENNRVMRTLFRWNFKKTTFDRWDTVSVTNIATNVVALKFQFGVKGDGSDWVSEFPNSQEIKRDAVRNIQISILVKSDKKESASYGAATYDVGGYTYNTQESDRNSVFRLYQVAVEVPNNGK